MFLENPNNEEVVKIMDDNEAIRKAAEELNAMSEDDELRWEAELRLKGLRDEQAAIEYATNKGIEQGKVEIAKNMLKKKMNIEDIKEITGLTEEEIKKLKN